MCYSPEADLIAGLAVSAAGVYAIQQSDDRSSLALASVPLVLGAHQLVEAVAWWGLEGELPARMGDIAVATYLIIALGVVPALVPFAVMRSEPEPSRRRWMRPLTVLGMVVAGVMLFGLATGTHGAEAAGRYIDYEAAIPGGGFTGGLYVAACCVPFLMSSHRRLVVFGVANVGAVAVLALLLANGVISLWCAWAAIGSLVIVHHIRETSIGLSRTRRASIAIG